MSSSMRVVYGVLGNKTEKYECGSVRRGDTPRTLLFEFADGSTMSASIDGMLHANCESIVNCITTGTGGFVDKRFLGDVATSVYTPVYVRICDEVSAEVGARVKHVWDSIYTVEYNGFNYQLDADNERLYTFMRREEDDVAWVLNRDSNKAVSEIELCSIPLMCYACGFTEIWNEVKDFYKQGDYTAVRSSMLKHYDECVQSMHNFRSIHDEELVQKTLKLLKSVSGNVTGISHVSTGNYVIYKVNTQFAIFVDDSVLIHMNTEFDTFYDYVLKVCDDAEVAASDEDAEVLLKGLSKYLNANKIRGSLNILNEVDRLLKLSGVKTGLLVLKPVASDIGVEFGKE